MDRLSCSGHRCGDDEPQETAACGLAPLLGTSPPPLVELVSGAFDGLLARGTALWPRSADPAYPPLTQASDGSPTRSWSRSPSCSSPTRCVKTDRERHLQKQVEDLRAELDKQKRSSQSDEAEARRSEPRTLKPVVASAAIKEALSRSGAVPALWLRSADQEKPGACTVADEHRPPGSEGGTGSGIDGAASPSPVDSGTDKASSAAQAAAQPPEAQADAQTALPLESKSQRSVHSWIEVDTVASVATAVAWTDTRVSRAAPSSEASSRAGEDKADLDGLDDMEDQTEFLWPISANGSESDRRAQPPGSSNGSDASSEGGPPSQPSSHHLGWPLRQPDSPAPSASAAAAPAPSASPPDRKGPKAAMEKASAPERPPSSKSPAKSPAKSPGARPSGLGAFVSRFFSPGHRKKSSARRARS